MAFVSQLEGNCSTDNNSLPFALEKGFFFCLVDIQCLLCLLCLIDIPIFIDCALECIHFMVQV